MPLLDFADAPVIPVPYLPAFLVPFLGLLALPPLPAWWAVVALNVLGLGVYLLRLRSVLGPGGGLYWLPLLALRYSTVLFGQVNLLLLIGLASSFWHFGEDIAFGPACGYPFFSSSRNRCSSWSPGRLSPDAPGFYWDLRLPAPALVHCPLPLPA